MEPMMTETKRARAQIKEAKARGHKSTTITLAPNRRGAVEWNLQREGYCCEESKWGPEMTVIRW